MALNAIAKRLYDLAPASDVIMLDTPETQVYSNIRSIIERPSINHLDTHYVELIEDIMHITYTHSKYSISDTSKSIVDAVLHWERWQAAMDAGINANLLVYNAFVASSRLKREDSSHKELTHTLLRRMLPLSYAIWAIVYLAAASVFWTMFAYGLALGSFVIAPWLNLMLCVASTGLFATVATAIIDWRRKHSGQHPKR